MAAEGREPNEVLTMAHAEWKTFGDQLSALTCGGTNCIHTLDNTKEILKSMGFSPKATIFQWRREYGGYCDCEFLNMHKRRTLGDW